MKTLETVKKKLNQEVKINKKLAFAEINTNYNVTLTAIDKLKLDFSVTMAGEYLDQIVDDFIKSQYEREKPSIPGFMKGKMPPMRVLKDHYITRFKQGAYQAAKNLFDYILVTEIRRAVEFVKAEYELGQTLEAEFKQLNPREEFGKETASYQFGDYHFTFNIELMPNIPAVAAEKIKIETPKGRLVASDVKAEMEAWANTHTMGVDLAKPRPIKSGDTVVIKLAIPGKKDVLERLTVIVGENKLNPECEKQLIGKGVGDKFSYPFSLPKNFPDASLAGRSYNIEVEVQKIQETRSYKVDDEMAQVFGCEKLEECQKQFEATALKAIEDMEFFAAKVNLRKALGDSYQIELPEKTVQQALLQRHDRLAKEIGVNIHYPLLEEEKGKVADRMKAVFGYGYDKWLKQETEATVSDVKADFALMQFAKDNQIDITQADLDQAVANKAGGFAGGLREAVEFYEKNRQEKQKLNTIQ